MIRMTKFAVVLLFGVMAALAIPAPSQAQIAVGISVHLGPPALPVYPQPICPGAGYIWTPGYWAYGPSGYYWVPGTWVLAPTPGYLWTPGYWGWGGGVYVWHAGYWGPHVGFYGGINYGYGYGGVGFVGGEWRGGVFHYNTAVTNVNTTIIHNTYVNNTVINRTVVNNVSYNGGTGGTTAQPTASERMAMNEHHIQPTTIQSQHEQMARNDHTMLASVNHGRPTVAATTHPGVFSGQGVAAAHGTNANTNTHMDRPPSARNTESNFQHESHTMDRPQTSTHTENAHTNSSENNSNHRNNGQTNNPHPNNNHPNAHPQQERENRPPEHEHQGGGHGR